MRTCSVCGNRTGESVCPICGFDESCNYACYPTLSPLPEGLEPVSGRAAAYAGYWKCGCGGNCFHIRPADARLVCIRCGATADARTVFPMASASQKPEPPKRQEPVRPESPQPTGRQLHVDYSDMEYLRKAHQRWSGTPEPIKPEKWSIEDYSDMDHLRMSHEHWSRSENVESPGVKKAREILGWNK